MNESEEKYRSLVEHAGDAIFMVDEDTSILDVNRSATALLGYSRNEFLKMKAAEVYPPDDSGGPPVQWDLLRQNKTLLNERTLQRKDGTRVEVEISRKLLNNGKGYLAIVRDITERRAIEQKLKQSEERFRAMIENIGDAINLVDADSELIYRSPSAVRINGYTMEDLKGKKIDATIHPDDRQPFSELLARVYAMPAVPLQYQFRWQHKDGHYNWIEGTMTNLFHVAGVKAIVINSRDVSGRRMSEERIKRSEEWLRALIENIGDAITVIGPDLEILFRSASVERINGYKLEDVTGIEMIDLVHPDDKQRCAAFFERVYASPGVALQGQLRMQHKKGHFVWIEGTIMNMLHNENVKGLIINYRDITKRKNAEDELAALNELLEQKVIDRTAELQEANKALESFSYSVSHDLRAPLNSIIGFSKIIESNYLNRFSEELKELFAHISSEGKRMRTIIDDLLALAKYDKVELHPSTVDMEKLFRRVWGNISSYAPHSATLQLAPLPQALADTSLMEQVVVNLLSNAVKYSSKKNNPLVTVNYEKGEGTVTYLVKDNGAGFDMKNYNRLFGAFQRLHGLSEFEGTGVGLLLVKRIIERHGGVVRAEGKVDEGATFYFTVPIA